MSAYFYLSQLSRISFAMVCTCLSSSLFTLNVFAKSRRSSIFQTGFELLLKTDDVFSYGIMLIILSSIIFYKFADFFNFALLFPAR